MANIANPHKKFQFSIFVFGMNPFLAQKVTLPDRENEMVEHGEGNHTIKTAGMVKLGILRIEKISNASLPDKLMWNWMSEVQNEFTGGGLVPDIYKKAVQITKLNSLNQAIQTWNFVGVWPQKFNGIEFDRMSSDNTIESIEFCVDRERFI